MKYAIIADIHANLAALQAVLGDSRDQGCTHYACLGDIVGYGNEPKECVDIIRQSEMPCVKGNFDEYCANDAELPPFQPRLIDNIRRQRRQLTDDQKRWLRSLGSVQTVNGFTIVHATLDEPERWEYVFDTMGAARYFAKQATTVCFFGHTHVPVAFIRDDVVRGGTYKKIWVEEGKGYFVNPGSVGQPRDGDKRASYAIYDLDKCRIELRRVDYPRREGDNGGSSVVPDPAGGSSPPSGRAAADSHTKQPPDAF